MLSYIRPSGHAGAAAAGRAGRAARRPARAAGRPVRHAGGEAGLMSRSRARAVARLRRARRRPSSLAPLVSANYRDVPARASSRVYLIALLGLEHPHRLHRPDLARPRRVHGHRRLHDDDPRRRPRLARPLDDSRSPASSPALLGLAFGLIATRFAGPYLALATFAIPLSFIGLLKRFPHFTGGGIGKNLPQLHAEFGLGTNPSIWFYGVTLGGRARDAAARALHRPRTLRPRAPRGPRQRDRRRRRTASRRPGSRPPPSASPRSSAASPARSTRSASPTSTPTPSRSSSRSCLLVGIVDRGRRRRPGA